MWPFLACRRFSKTQFDLHFGDMSSGDWGGGACGYKEKIMCGAEPKNQLSCGRIQRGKDWQVQGFTLIEITVSMAILVTVLTLMAYCLASSYALLSLQTQRGTALNTCRAVVSNLRELARTQPAGDQCPDDEPRFPCVLVAWTDNLPEDIGEFGELSPSGREPYEGLFALPEQTIVVSLTDAGGAPAVKSEVLSINTNPVYVRVVTRWTGPRGRTHQIQMSTVLTDR